MCRAVDLQEACGLKGGGCLRGKACSVQDAVHLPVMAIETRNLRLRVTQRDEPDLDKLIEWVLNIAEARHSCWLSGEPDPYRRR